MPLAASGIAMLSPSRMLVRTDSMAWATTTLSMALDTTSSDCMMGTPLETRVPKVRLNRAMTIFLLTGPRIGSRSLTRSKFARPPGVFTYIRNP